MRLGGGKKKTTLEGEEKRREKIGERTTKVREWRKKKLKGRAGMRG